MCENTFRKWIWVRGQHCLPVQPSKYRKQRRELRKQDVLRLYTLQGEPAHPYTRMVVARITRHMYQRLQQALPRSGERDRAEVFVNQSAFLLTLLGVTISSFSVHRMSFSRQLKK
ncbi:Hypp6281 [Branchiostoma lanceolatum]|uniref:Hypp6281 protein n=1 Tax=Branchiostoma lanceolatum TaxID=7740 RepID=A0A8J9VJ90_BRALA|nr:Hypp6281 [Branchiostoma lanceolatum]